AKPDQAGLSVIGPPSQGWVTVSLGPWAQETFQCRGAGSVRWCSRAPKASVALPDQRVPLASTMASGQLSGTTAMAQRAGSTISAAQQASSTSIAAMAIRRPKLMVDPLQRVEPEHVPTHVLACRDLGRWHARALPMKFANEADRPNQPPRP